MTALALEVGLHPEMLRLAHIRHRASGNDLPVGQGGDAIGRPCAGFPGRSGHHEHGEAEGLLEGADQLVEFAGRDGIKSRGGFIQEDQLRIECERSGKGYALLLPRRAPMAVRSPSRASRPTISSLARGNGAQQTSTDLVAHRDLHVLQGGQRGEQCPLLEQHAPAALDRMERRVVCLLDISCT